MKNFVPKKLTIFVKENKQLICRINKSLSNSVKRKYLKSESPSYNNSNVSLVKKYSNEERIDSNDCCNLGVHRKLNKNCKFNHSYDFQNNKNYLEEIIYKKVEEKSKIMKDPLTMKKPDDIRMGHVDPIQSFYENYPTHVKSTIESFLSNIPENNSKRERFNNELSESFNGLSNIYRKRIISLESHFNKSKKVTSGKVNKVQNHSYTHSALKKRKLEGTKNEKKIISINKLSCSSKLETNSKLNGLYSVLHKSKVEINDNNKNKTLSRIYK